MKTLHITFKGVTPLIMHSCQCVNPLNPIAKEMKKYTSKRKKTDEDYGILSRLEWEAGAYWDDKIGLYIPSENVEATIINGGKAYKNGTNIQKYCNVTDLMIPLDYGEKLTKEQLMNDNRYYDVRPMTVQRAKVNRTRPRFNKWKIEFNMVYDEKRIDIDAIRNALEYAGAYVGLCDSRPKYGQFSVIIDELD